MTRALAPTARFAAVLLGSASLILLAGALVADAVGATGDTLLAAWDGPVGQAMAWGAEASRLGSQLVAQIRLPALVVMLLGLARLRLRGGTAQLMLALGLGWIAQSYLLEEHVGAGLAIYAVAGLAALLREVAPREPDELPLRFELPLLLLGIALFVGACLYRLDVHPDLYVDEIAYLGAARMMLGEIDASWLLQPPWTELYSFERFQAQPIPLALQSVGVALLSPGVLATRLVSVACGAGALLVGALILRRRVGARATLCMLALCSFSPLYLAYSRSGMYIIISVLHGALCFAALLHHAERRSVGSAALLGLGLGSSIYFYQLSWFVPILAVAAAALLPELRRGEGSLRLAAVVAGAGLLVLLPGAPLLQAGLGDVSAQTFDKAVWRGAEALEPEAVRTAFTLAPNGSTEMERWASVAGVESADVELVVHATSSGQHGLSVTGPVESTGSVLEALEAQSWHTILDSAGATSLGRNLRGMLSQLFYAPYWESNLRLVGGPVLSPLLAPLTLLGCIEAWRRRRRTVMRLLLVWVVAGGLLPAMIGGYLPRRTVLMLPFLQLLMALPLVEIAAGLATGRRFPRAANAVGAVLLLGIVATTGTHFYHQRWNVRLLAAEGSAVDASQGVRPERRETELRLMKLLKGLPDDRRIHLPRMLHRFDEYLERVEEWPRPGEPRRVAVWPSADDPAVIRWISCSHPPPFTWVGDATPEHRALFARIDRDFVHTSEERAGYVLLHVESRRPGACEGMSTRFRYPLRR